MADETVIDGELSDDRTVEILGDDEVSSKISGLTQRITDLELENRKLVQENEGYKQKLEDLKVAIQDLSTDNGELKKKLEKAESDNNALEAVAARAAGLEAEVSRLQHDLISSSSDLQELTTELSDLKRDLEGAKQREREKDVKLEAIGNERESLLSKVVQLEGIEGNLREEKEEKEKEKEIQNLKKHIEELLACLESSKSSEKLKTIENMKDEIASLETSLKEKETLISGLELNQRNVTNGNGIIEAEKKASIGGLKHKDWVVVGGSTVAAIAVMGVACYLHAARKH